MGTESDDCDVEESSGIDVPEDPRDRKQRILAGVLITIGTFGGAVLGAQSPSNRGPFLFVGAMFGGTFGALLAYPSGRRFLQEVANGIGVIISGLVKVLGVVLLVALTVAALRSSNKRKQR